jgi:glycosyltransferase involved in cell wall biosynthesis
LLKQNRHYRNRIYDVLSRSDGIGVVSYKLKNAVYESAQGIIKCPPVNVIYNGIQVYDTYPDIDWKVNDKCIKMLVIASLIERKGFDILFQAMHMIRDKFPQLNCFIIGDGWDKVKIYQQAAELNLLNTVHFMGAMPHHHAMAYLKDADIFVLPSRKESFGIVYIEAMYFGKITIGSRGEGIDEIIQDGINGFLINPSNPHELKVLLLKILPNLKKMNDLKANAVKTVWPRFSWENNAREYQEIYENAIREFNK